MQWLKNKIQHRAVITIGLAFLFLAICLFLYIFLVMPKIKSGWNYEISGHKNITANTIIATIEFLAIKEKKMEVKNIRETLEMNPRIHKAEVELVPPKTIRVKIEEVNTAYLRHENDKVQEVAIDNSILQENIEHGPPAELPILNFDQNSPLSVQEARELVTLYNETASSYSFVWQRLSEIVIVTQNENSKQTSIWLYPSIARCRFEVKEKMNLPLLKRIWAVIYYLEQIADERDKLSGYQIEISSENAILKKSV